MESNHFTERYKRHLQLPGFGLEAQQKLQDAKVLVVGAGGLGVPVLQYLTAMGVGKIEIVDGDVISYSNLHRQVLYDEEQVGLPKAVIAKRKLSALNRKTHLLDWPEHLNPDNALSLISEYDLVVDATDNFAARYLINDSCVILNKPFVHAAIHQYEGHLSTFNFQDGPTYRCLYPTPPNATEIPDCNTAGVLGVVPGIIGSMQALEVVKIITGIGQNLSGYLQVIDLLNNEQRKIKLRSQPKNKEITELQESYEVASCSIDSKKITARELQQQFESGQPFLLIDVRMEHEFKEQHLPNATNWPMRSLYKGLFTFDESKPVILYCQKGSRSAKAAALLHERQPMLQLYELKGGIEAWLSR